MPIVNLEKVKLEAKEKKDAVMEIVSERVGDKTYHRGKIISDVFDSYDECLNANIRESMIRRNKSLGLNEYGQTPQQEKNMELKGQLLKAKQKILDQVRGIDAKIAELNRGDFVDESSNGKKTKRKRKKKK